MSTKNTKTAKKSVFAKTTVKLNLNRCTQPNAKSSLQLIRTTVNMDKIMHEKTKQFASKNNLSINALINAEIKQYINK